MSSGSSVLRDIAWVALFFLVAMLLQGLQTENYFDGDTGYHIAVGHYTLQHGILHDFPWTPFSWLGKHYADKELLLHLLLAPLSVLDHNLAARIAGTLLGGLILATAYGILRAEGVRRAGAWTLLLVACSGAFTHRFILVRPHLMSIALAMLVAWAAARGRWKTLAVSSVLFPLCYTAWHLVLALAVLASIARFLAGQPRAWLPPVIAFVGLAAGIMIHPNFPDNLSFFWIQNVEVLFQTAWTDREGFELGGEFRPFSTLGYVRYAGLPLAFAVFAGAWQLIRAERDALAMTVTAAGLGMALMTSQTQRFIEYLVPFAVLALAVAMHRAAPIDDPPRWRRRLGPVLLMIAVAWTAAVGQRPLRMLQGRTITFPPQVQAAVQQLIPPGAQVFHCDWVAVGEMMLALPDRKFLFALDPVLFYNGDPDAYRLWFELLNRPDPLPAERLRTVIGADYILCDQREQWLPFRAVVEADPGISDPIQVGGHIVYKVLPAAE